MSYVWQSETKFGFCLLYLKSAKQLAHLAGFTEQAKMWWLVWGPICCRNKNLICIQCIAIKHMAYKPHDV